MACTIPAVRRTQALRQHLSRVTGQCAVALNDIRVAQLAAISHIDIGELCNRLDTEEAAKWVHGLTTPVPLTSVSEQTMDAVCRMWLAAEHLEVELPDGPAHDAMMLLLSRCAEYYGHTVNWTALQRELENV